MSPDTVPEPPGSTQSHTATAPPAPLAPVLLGTAVVFAIFEGTGRLTAGLPPAASMLLTSAVVLSALLATEMLTARGGPRQALAGLGLGRPSARAMGTAGAISLLLLALLPLVARLTGAAFTLALDWPLRALGIFAMNGVAEEALYRGYLFRHLREGRSFQRAVGVGMAMHAASHLPILATAGVAVWGGASLVALATFPPLAALFERGRNTIWAPALVHAAIDSLKLVLTADTLAGPGGAAAIFTWMALSTALPYLAFALPRGPARPGAAPGMDLAQGDQP